MSAPYILVVDDEPDIRILVQEILQDEDYQVATAENGIAARAALRERRPDLVLLDLKLPDMDGMNVLKEIRREKPELHVIIMTGYASVASAVEVMKLGAFDYLPKPFEPDDLKKAVGRAFERRNRLGQGEDTLEAQRIGGLELGQCLFHIGPGSVLGKDGPHHDLEG